MNGRLSLCIQSGQSDRVHYALVLAAAAAAIGKPVTLFFTMDACRALGASPDWKSLHAHGETAAEYDERLTSRGVAGMDELIESCRDLGVEFIVCDAGLAASGLAQSELRPDLDILVAGAVTFLNRADPEGATLYI